MEEWRKICKYRSRQLLDILREFDEAYRAVALEEIIAEASRQLTELRMKGL